MERCKIACVWASLAILSACSPSESPEQVMAKTQQATVTAIGNSSLQPNDVQISEFVRMQATASWQAFAAGVKYVCSSDQNLNLPDCQKQPV